MKKVCLSTALVILLGASGCGEKKRTEIVVGIATDLQAPTPLSALNLKVFRLPEDVILADQPVAISGRTTVPYELPGSYAVYSADGTPDRFRIELTAFDNAGKKLVTRTAVLTLIPHKTLFVRLGVVTACQAKTDCTGGDTCIEGRCAPPEIDSTRLPEYVPGMEKTAACSTGATTFMNTSTMQPIPVGATDDGGVGCGKGTCQEGVCLAPVSGSFTSTTAPLVTGTRSAANQIGNSLVVLGDGTILIAGGLGKDKMSVLSSAEVYDPTKGTFSVKGSMSAHRVYDGQAKLADGRVLFMGGINEGGTALDSAEIYDPKTGQFTATAAVMGVARTFPAAVTMADGRVLVAGGINQIQSYSAGEVKYFGGLSSAEIYDPARDTFTAVAGSMVEGRGYPSVVALPAGGALVLCGQEAGAPASRTIEHFDATTDTFDALPIATLPAGDGCTTAELGGGAVLVMSASAPAAWVFDAKTTTFRDVGDQPAPRAQFAAVLSGGDVLFAGGPAKTQAYLYDAHTRSFAMVDGDLQVARADFSAAPLPNGDALIAGGDPAGTAEVFHHGRPASTAPRPGGTDGGAGGRAGSGAAAGIYVGVQGNEVRVFALAATGDATPVRTIAGAQTELSLPLGLAVDSTGFLYVANRLGGQVTVFPATADGNVAPTRKLTLSSAWSPSGVAIGAGDDVFVSSCPNCGSSAGGGSAVYHFPNGATASDRMIGGGAVGVFTFPSAIALDENQNLIVANSFGGNVATFAADASGDVPPLRSFTPPSGTNIQALAYAAGTLFIGMPGTGYGLFPASATGAATPTTSIGASNPMVSYPGGIFVDTSESAPVLYIADYGGQAVYIVHTTGTAPNLSVANVTTIKGTHTGLTNPLGITVVK